MEVWKSTTFGSSLQDDEYSRLVDEISARLQIGECVDVHDYCLAHPQYAERLQSLMPTLKVLAGMAGRGESDDLPASVLANQALGDFRLVRQIGRGGMGVVYEAVQLSLNRRVALKVLPFAAMLDPRQLQRFKNEAQAAASLEHPHIVNVFFVGCERGVHFYAMRYVDGQSLAEAVAGVRPPAADTQARVSPDHDTRPMAAFTTQYTTERRIYFRSVAQLGIQTAKALEYAHQMAIIHRDIKPSNLLLDSQGQLWVTDFGLATAQGNANLTMTGDVVGTLRYMSPEQAAGKSAILDHRTDIYSLGITLYELLTLQPAFPDQDRQTLLHRILRDEPAAPRSLDASIPVDLQTIVVKAIAKSPGDRYASAQALADDLQRFLEQRPIQARPLGRMARAWRWCRRTPAFAGAVTAVVVLSLCVALLAVMFAARESAHRQQAETRTEEARWQQYVSDMHSAMAAWEDSNIGRTLELLERHRPEPGEPDLRGFEWNYLWRQCQDDRLLLTINETAFVRGFAFSHDGRMLATGNDDGLVRLWDSTTGLLVHEFKGSSGCVNFVPFSPDDRLLASGYTDGTIRLWDLADSRALHTLTGHTAQILGLLFSSDGKQLASGSEDTTIRIWDVATGRELRMIRPETSKRVRTMLTPPWIDNRLWVHGSDGSLRLFDTDTGTELRSIQRRELSEFRTIARVSWDGCMAATGGLDGVIRLFDTETGRDLETLGAHGVAVKAIAIAPDDQTLASSDSQGKVILWDLTNRTARTVLRGHSGPVWPLQFSHDGQRLCTSGGDYKLRIWDVTRQPLAADVCRGHEAFALCVAFSPDGRMIASGGAEPDGGMVMLWDVAAGQLMHQFEGHTDWVRSVAFSPDGNELASTGDDGTIRRWAVTQRQALATIDTAREQKSWVTYSRDGRELITAEEGGTLRVWDRSTGAEIRSTRISHASYWQPALSPDGRLLVAGMDESIVLVEYPSLKTIRRLPKSPVYGSTIALSPDGRMLASCRYTKHVHLSTLDGIALGTLLHAADVSSIDFSPDGSTLVTGDVNHDVHIWDVLRYQELATLRGHDSWISMVRFSPDGTTITSSGVDGTVRLWRSGPRE